MTTISPSEDIRSITDLKRHTRDILNHLHATGRPVILTKDGRADCILLDVKVYENHLKAGNLARLLAPAEQDIIQGKTLPAREFITEFQRDRQIHG